MTAVRGAGRHARSLGVVVADQAVTGVTSLVVVAAIAQRLDPEAFGRFAVVYAGLALVLGCTRAWLGMPLALSTSASGIERRRLLGAACGIVALASPAIVLVLGLGLPAALGWLDGGAPTLSLLVGVAAVLGALQDLARYAAVAAGRPAHALVADLVRLGGVAALLALPEGLPGEAVVAAWTAVVAVSAVVGLGLARPALERGRVRALLAAGAGARGATTAATLLASGTALALASIVGAGYGPTSSGSLLGAGTILGPVGLLLAVLDLAVLGRLVARPGRTRARVLAVSLTTLWVVQLAWTLLVLSLPDATGAAVLGTTWEGARAILPILGLEYAVAAATAVLSLELKLRDAGRAILVGRLVTSATTLGGAVVLVATGAGFALVPIAMLLGSLLGLGIVAAAIPRRSPARATARQGEPA